MDNRNDKIDNRPEGAEVKIKSPFIAWLDNFFYHYKWHTIVCIFLIVAISICTFQMCSKTSYDVHIMYAGGGIISKTVDEGQTTSDYAKLSSQLMQYAEDFDGDGNISVDLLNLYIPTSTDIESETLVRSDYETFKFQVESGSEFYILFLSEALFLKYASDSMIFNDIKGYTNGNDADYEFVGKYGIKLSSTELYNRPVFKIMPEDTIICIRKPTVISGKFNAYYERSDTMLKELLKKG